MFINCSARPSVGVIILEVPADSVARQDSEVSKLSLCGIWLHLRLISTSVKVKVSTMRSSRCDTGAHDPLGLP